MVARLTLVLFAVGLVACGPPVTVQRVRPQDVYRGDSASVLDSGELTRFAQIELHRTGIPSGDSHRDQLIEIHRRAVEDGYRESMLAAAELAFLEGERTGERSAFLGAAVYAYFYLFGDLRGPEPTAWDPRTRIAADLYNRALARAFENPAEDQFDLAAGVRRLPIGQIVIDVPQSAVEWQEGVVFDTFRPADIYEVDGLAARYRNSGLGAPLIGTRAPYSGEADVYPPELDIPATAFLRVEGGREELRTGRLRGSLELYDPYQTPEIDVGGQSIPLEAQTTTAYAYLLGSSPVWDFEFAGFLSGSDETIRPGISLMEPYRPDAIPVILVHGTASSPARWAGLFNDLNNDPKIQKNFQFWFFAYNSGNPIAFSAQRLRDAIDQTVRTLDPDGKDPGLREMVLIGHSQGGLLVRLAISDSSHLDWAKFGMESPDHIDRSTTEGDKLFQVMEFTPVPTVDRVVFIATPHRGSFVAGGVLGQIGAGLVSVSKTALNLPIQALRLPVQLATTGKLPGPEPGATAVDNMAPDSTFNKVLADVPMDPNVPKHSIIAVQSSGPVEEGNDGVVAYESAHLDDVESEVVIASGHSVQSNPATVKEVRRILLEHLAVEQADSSSPTGGN